LIVAAYCTDGWAVCERTNEVGRADAPKWDKGMTYHEKWSIALTGLKVVTMYEDILTGEEIPGHDQFRAWDDAKNHINQKWSTELKPYAAECHTTSDSLMTTTIDVAIVYLICTIFFLCQTCIKYLRFSVLSVCNIIIHFCSTAVFCAKLVQWNMAMSDFRNALTGNPVIKEMEGQIVLTPDFGSTLAWFGFSTLGFTVVGFAVGSWYLKAPKITGPSKLEQERKARVNNYFENVNASTYTKEMYPQDNKIDVVGVSAVGGLPRPKGGWTHMVTTEALQNVRGESHAVAPVVVDIDRLRHIRERRESAPVVPAMPSRPLSQHASRARGRSATVHGGVPQMGNVPELPVQNTRDSTVVRERHVTRAPKAPRASAADMRQNMQSNMTSAA